jgi:hypothetical protein
MQPSPLLYEDGLETVGHRPGSVRSLACPMTTSVSRPTTSRVVSHARRRHHSTASQHDTGPGGATPFRTSFCPCPCAKHRLEQKNDREGRSGRAGGGERPRGRRVFQGQKGTKVLGIREQGKGISERKGGDLSLSLCTLYSLFVPTGVLLNCNYARRRVGIDVSHRIIGNLFCDPYPGDSDPATISTRPAILRETRRKAANDSHFDDT